ncbi:Mitochondrial outer membrane protein porin of 34 kDa [Capsicum baccatum]|uniref:Mitochondrial outer membrane protein porin of 34 kDa n=1 Tax=Capsicum baccatum TaxID=33114 RepID=A0A2G2XIE1_CAPBA|nr:Mitochondrial outer membrane protein porin of 34 kDa [Capsicum baccatum]
MGKGTGLYRDIGKKARDLLYKDYQTDEKISITSGSIAGVTISSSESKKDELFPADVKAQLKSKNSTTYIKVECCSSLLYFTVYFVTSLLNNKGETLSTSYYRSLSRVNDTIGMEVTHSFSTKILVLALSISWIELTTVKASLNKWSPNSLLKIDTNAFNKGAKFGWAVKIMG